MKTLREIFRRKITKKYIEKHFTKTEDTPFETYFIGTLEDDDYFYQTDFYIEDRESRFCVCRGFNCSSYWVADVEYIYQLRRLLSIYKMIKRNTAK